MPDLGWSRFHLQYLAGNHLSELALASALLAGNDIFEVYNNGERVCECLEQQYVLQTIQIVQALWKMYLNNILFHIAKLGMET